ncbi:MAG: hypothetical protein EB015_19560 [Methylocystaceae bacterium]|nr:hypothetical protein [Methylocystaceae bacterium]
MHRGRDLIKQFFQNQIDKKSSFLIALYQSNIVLVFCLAGSEMSSSLGLRESLSVLFDDGLWVCSFLSLRLLTLAYA